MSVVAECVFLDVGQGTANVILLGGKRAIIVDCGPPGAVPVLLDLLKRFVTTIEALVLSHNDKDHIGGAATVLSNYPKAIRKIFRVQDRGIENDDFAQLLLHEQRAGNLLSEPCTFVIDDRPRLLYQDGTSNIELVCASPSYWQTQVAQLDGDPNAASAIIELRCGTAKIIFAGDSSIDQWRSIHQFQGKVECDILAVSHHAGKVWNDTADSTSELKWLYGTGLRCSDAVISVGTSNKFRTGRHPREDVVKAIRSSGANVICTQITTACFADLHSLRPGVRIPSSPSRSKPNRDDTSKGHCRNVACAGTVFAEVSATGVQIVGRNEHSQGVDKICTSLTMPLCRP